MSPGEDDASCLQLLCPGRAVGPAVGGPDPELPVGRLSAALPRSPVSLPTTRGGQGPPAMFTAPALDSIEAPPTPPRVQPPAPPRQLLLTGGLAECPPGAARYSPRGGPVNSSPARLCAGPGRPAPGALFLE